MLRLAPYTLWLPGRQTFLRGGAGEGRCSPAPQMGGYRTLVLIQRIAQVFCTVKDFITFSWETQLTPPPRSSQV